MLKIAVIDPSAQGATASVAAASALGGWWAVAAQLAAEIFGVPIQVVIAAITASFTAQTFRPLSGVWSTLASGTAWAMIGSFGANFAVVALNAWLGISIPSGGLAGVAMIIAGAAPFIAPVLVKEGPAAVARWLRNIKKDGQP